MSPIGGVGVNLAIQDAVAAANILTGPLLEGRVTEDALRQVQKRRFLPTKLTQGLQVFLQDRVITNVLTMTRRPEPPLFARMLDRFPILRRLPARLIGMGFRPEHVALPERAPSSSPKGQS